MSDKLVTMNQSEAVRNIANAKQVGRKNFQEAIEDGRFAMFLEGLKSRSGTIRPPKNARIHALKVRVQLDQPWIEAVSAASNKPVQEDHWWGSRIVGAETSYPPMGHGVIDENLILVNYNKPHDHIDSALVWADAVGLKTTSPRHVFAIAVQHPKLPLELEVKMMRIFPTDEVSLTLVHTPLVWWDDSRRGVDANGRREFPSLFSWFAFKVPKIV